MFSGYEQECERQLGSLRARVGSLGDAAGAARRTAIGMAEADLAAARELVDAMELEAGSAPKAERAGLMARAKMHRGSAAALAAELKRVSLALPREALLGCGPEERAECEEQHARLLATHDRTRAGTDRLREAARTVAETEEIGASIMGDLASQRQTLMHSVGTLRGTGQQLERSRKVISAIGRRAWQNRAIMWVMIGMLAVLVLLLLFALANRGGVPAGGGAPEEGGSAATATGRRLLLQ